MQDLNPIAPYINGLGGHGGPPSSTTDTPAEPLSADATTLTKQRPPPSQADLDAELPVILNDLVPLSFIVERVIGQVFAELANLAEILPGTPEPVRKRKIVDYVLQTRRQILKLLVLVRWSSEADNVAKCMNIIGFLGRQNLEFDRAVNSLTEVKTMLAGARIRNYDLPTAITVLTTGTYTGLPSIFSESFAQPLTLPDEVVLRTLEELDDVLRWRLNCVEVVPRKMRSYRIGDGRVTFRVEGMWEASLTYGGESEDEAAEWYLLSVKFLFNVKDVRGGPMKDHIVELCNRELAKRRPPPETDAEPATNEAPDAPLVRGYAFLQRLALTYQIEALYTQANQLAATIWAGSLRVELSPDRQELKVEYWVPPPPPPSAAPKPGLPGKPGSKLSTEVLGLLTLSIRQESDQQPPLPPTPVPPKPQAGTSTFTTPKSGPANPSNLQQFHAMLSTTSARDLALQRALARGQSVHSPTLAQETMRDRVQVSWAADGISEIKKRHLNLELDSDLDLENLLLRTTSLHARESTIHLYNQLIGELDPDDLELVEPEQRQSQLIPWLGAEILSSSDTDHGSVLAVVPSDNSSSNSLEPVAVPSVQVHLHGEHSIIASVNTLSGNLELRTVGDVAAMPPQKLRRIAQKINETPKDASKHMLEARNTTILGEVESRAAFLGFRTVRRLALRKSDWDRFGSASSNPPFIFIHLPQLSNNYLVLQLAEEGFIFALISVHEVTESLQQFLVLDELGWLDKSPSNGDWEPASPLSRPGDRKRPVPVPFGFDVSVDDLRDLYQYCVRRIAFFKVEQQLYIRRIPYKPVASTSTALNPSSPSSKSSAPPATTSARPQLLSSASPYLVIQSSDLLRSTARVAYPNIAIQCFLLNDTIRTTLHVRFRDLAMTNPDLADLPESMTYDPKTSIITFTSDDIETCVPTFLTKEADLTLESIIRVAQVTPITRARQPHAHCGQKSEPNKERKLDAEYYSLESMEWNWKHCVLSVDESQSIETAPTRKEETFFFPSPTLAPPVAPPAFSQASSSSSEAVSVRGTDERFWSGDIKQVSNDFVREKVSYTYRQALGPMVTNELQGVILSAGSWDDEWCLPHFDSSFPLLLVANGTNAEGLRNQTKASYKSSAREETYKIELFYRDFCRVIIASANPVEAAWSKDDNVFFIQDFPRAQAHSKTMPHPFATNLLSSLRRLDVPQKFGNFEPFERLREYDFGNAGELQLIVSNQGKYTGWASIEDAGGITSIAKAVNKLHFSVGGTWMIESTTSSITGDHNHAWLSQVFAACSGIHPQEYFNSTSRYSLAPTYSKNSGQIKLLHPTKEEVDASKRSAEI
ncbi:mediator of RNA polymerase II transcription subunit 14, partial [Phenoliferia sp. Uapishka_3]